MEKVVKNVFSTKKTRYSFTNQLYFYFYIKDIDTSFLNYNYYISCIFIFYFFFNEFSENYKKIEIFFINQVVKWQFS